METISAKELDWYVRSGRYLIVDLRSPEDFRRGHIRGAVNVPQGSFGTELSGRRDEPVILYCERGALSMVVARELEEKGYRTRSVVGGIRAYRGRNMVCTDGGTSVYR